MDQIFESHSGGNQIERRRKLGLTAPSGFAPTYHVILQSYGDEIRRVNAASAAISTHSKPPRGRDERRARSR